MILMGIKMPEVDGLEVKGNYKYPAKGRLKRIKKCYITSRKSYIIHTFPER